MTSAVNRARVLASQLNEFPAKSNYVAGDAWRNWSATHGECRPAHHHYPTSMDDVVQIVRLILASKKPATGLRVVGSGLSPNPAAFTPHHMVHMDRLRRIIALDEKNLTVTCEAGITLAELVADLQQRQMTIPVIPSILDMSIGGAIATAAHGTGINIRSLSGYVAGVTVVDGHGAVHTIDDNTPIPPPIAALLPPPAAGKPHRLIDAFACHLGVLGVVVRVTLRIERLTSIHVVHRPVPLAAITHSAVDQRATVNDYYRFHWVPHTDWCYEMVGRRMKAADDEAASSIAATEKTVVAPSSRGLKPSADSRARNVSAAVHLVSSPATLAADQKKVEEAAKVRSPVKAATGVWIKRDVTEQALAMAVRVPSMIPHINRGFQSAFMTDAVENFGAPHDVLVMDCLFKQHAMEFAVDASKWKELFDETQKIIATNHLLVHFPVEVRFVDAETSWMAPNFNRKTCFIGVVMFRPKGLDSPHWKTYYDLFEKAATKLGGRPHWAKSYSWRRPQFEAAYPHLKAFAALQKAMDPQGIFVNEWFRQVLTAA